MGGIFWKKKIIEFVVGKKKLSFEVRGVPFWYEGFGLMFKDEKNARPLLFSFGFPTKMTIFSWTIPFDFLAIWLDDKNKIVEFRVVKPGEVAKPSRRFRKLIEVPITKNHRDVCDFVMNNCKDGTFAKIK